MNPKNADDKCFEYSIVIALHHQHIDIFSYMYNWKGIEFPARIKDWKRFD